MPPGPYQQLLADLPRLLSVNQVCAALGVARSTTYRLIRLRELRVVKVLGRKRIPRSELEQFMRRNED
jgi:excisionase family DNA binding protein